MDWTPGEQRWNFRELLAHVIRYRDHHTTIAPRNREELGRIRLYASPHSTKQRASAKRIHHIRHGNSPPIMHSDLLSEREEPAEFRWIAYGIRSQIESEIAGRSSSGKRRAYGPP